ncbi:MAG: HAD family hydrolase [Chakrabartia sp.]
MTVSAVVFDVGNVLYRWSPKALYERLIPEDRALDAFLETIVTPEWHFQHDAGRPFAETSAELIAQYPAHRDLILLWGARFGETITGPIPGMIALVEDLDAAGVPIFGLTNFSHEFWPPFRAREAHIFDRFRDIVVSGDEKCVKPDPAIFRLARDRFGLAEGAALFLDDRADNVSAAEAQGFIGHHFTDAAAARAQIRALGLL